MQTNALAGGYCRNCEGGDQGADGDELVEPAHLTFPLPWSRDGIPVALQDSPAGVPESMRHSSYLSRASRGVAPSSELHSAAPSRPRRGDTSTSQGRPYSIFKRALQRRNVVGALAAARELPQLSLVNALELTLLVARKEPRRHQRVAARWLLRYLEEDPEATIEEAALAASSLVAPTGVG